MNGALSLYRGVGRVVTPLLRWHFGRRATRGKECPARLGERFGYPGQARPDGRLLWIHAASVGEALSALPLIDAIEAERTLVTTGTITSARLVVARAPHVIHQFVPVDTIQAVTRFLDHWRPDLALWMESEIWPVLVTETAARDIPLALVNGRISARSARNWRRLPSLARTLIGAFDLRLVQTGTVRERLTALGAPEATTVATGDLKASRPAEPADAETLDEMRKAVGARPLWLAASTHPGEEEAILDTHAALAIKAPNLLTIIAPRHPERGREVAQIAAGRGLSVTRRSNGQGPAAAIYVADTLGEMPLWFGLAPIAYIGAGWGDLGGHNPLEASQSSTAVLSGPKVANFAETYACLHQAGAVRFVDDADALRRGMEALTNQDATPNQHAHAMAAAGVIAGAPDPGPLDKTMAMLAPLIARAFR